MDELPIEVDVSEVKQRLDEGARTQPAIAPQEAAA